MIDNKEQKAGFTLIELMAATTILIIIVMIVSKLFHQSNLAWDSGMRKAEGNMTARAILGFMAKEMREAVATDTDDLQGTIVNGAQAIEFVTLSKTNSRFERLARKIRYELQSGDKIERTVYSRGTSSGPYGGAWSPDAAVVMATNIVMLRFTTPPGGPFDKNLPAWVHIELGIRKTDAVSGLGARSFGPDGTEGTGDDIVSW